MKTRIEIDTKTFIRFWIVIFAFVVGAMLLYGARHALLLVGIGFFLAIAFSRPVSWLAKSLPGNSRVGATAMAFFAVVFLLTGVVISVTPPIVEQSAKVADSFPLLLENAQKQWVGLDSIIDKYNLQPQIDQAVNSVRENIGAWASRLGQGFIYGVGSFITFLTQALIVLFVTFFMLIEGPTWYKKVWLLYPDVNKMRHHQRLVGKMYQVVTGYVTGQVVVSAIGGAFAGLAVLILSVFFTEVPSNLALPAAAMSFVLSLIPMFGATIAGTIITILIALNNFPAAIIYAVYFFIYQQIENNVIVPSVQAKSINLSALIILIAVTIGIFMFGLPGGIIAIPVAGCIKILVEEYVKKVQLERIRHDEANKPKPVRPTTRANV